MEQIKLTHSPLHPTQTPPASALMQTAKPAQPSPKTPPRFGIRKKPTNILQLYISLCVLRSSILMDYVHKGVWIFLRFVGHVKAISCGPGPIKSPDVAFDGPSAGVMAVENCSGFLTYTHTLSAASMPKSSCPGKLLIKGTLTRLYTAQKQTSHILCVL